MPQDPSRSVEPQIEKLSRQLKWVLALTILIPLLAISYLVLRYVSPDMLPREGGMVILAVLLSVGAGARVILHLVTKAVRASSRATGQREAEGQPPRDEDLRSDRRSIRYKVAEAIALVGAIPFLAQGYIVVRYVRPGNTTENLLLLVFFVTVVLLLGLTEINQLTRRILRAAAAARMVRMETGMPRLDCGADELGEISTDLDSIASTLSKRAEQLVHTREFMFSIIEHLPHPLVSYDTAGAITIANSAATALLGYTTDELIGRDIGSLFCKKGDAWGLLAKSREEAVEVRWRRKDGSELPLSLCSAEMRGAGNEPSVVLVGTDLSERKHLEDELRQAHKMEAMGLLAGGIAHDFNNILTAIKGNLYLINQVNEPETQRECYLENLHESVERASSLVNQLLAFSRKQILESRVLNINMVISGMDKLLRRLLGEDIEIVTILRPGLGNIRADKGQMEQVIINLAINARDAMPRGGKLVIQTDNVAQDDAYGKPFYQVAPGPQVRLTVADNGCGMSHTVKSRIFEPFFTTKTVGRGIGLGLATVYGIVKQHGGNVYVDSEEGIGTTFKIYLPRISGAVDAAAHKGREDKLTGGSESVLLVEDDRSILDITSRALRSQGYQVITAENGKHALEVAKTHNGRIAILVTDVIMPIMGGKELADMLVATNKGMKIIFVSGYPDTSVVSQRIVKEGLCFLQKPYTVQSLLEKVRAVLDGTELSD